tara:strand:+ start:4123 stop:4356 length:234 start_codon:yes stop_codon:yes gene_type:complete
MSTSRRGFFARLAALAAVPFAKKVADAMPDEPATGGVVKPGPYLIGKVGPETLLPLNAEEYPWLGGAGRCEPWKAKR